MCVCACAYDACLYCVYLCVSVRVRVRVRVCVCVFGVCDRACKCHPWHVSRKFCPDGPGADVPGQLVPKK